MDRTEAFSALPLTYQRILEWLEAGRPEDEISALLSIDPVAVRPMIQLAKAKLARLADDEGGDGTSTRPPYGD
ncbi:MAG TPA: hypothetical protein VH761_17285 [Ilumatobacteraceae bacterium]